MSKPNDIGFVLHSTGEITLGVKPRPPKCIDMIWDAVEECINANVTVEQFKCEAAQAWTDTLRKHAEWAAEDWRKK